MKIRTLKFNCFLLLLILLTFQVFATGSSTSYSNSENTNEEATSPDCDSLGGQRERIQCRLEKGVSKGYNYEACTEIGSSCNQFYASIQICYEKSGTTKDQCFREKSGLSEKDLSTQSEEEIRLYMVALLHNLQEIIEEDYDNGEITSGNAASLISDIVQTKKFLLSNEPKSQISIGINRIKSRWELWM